MKLIIWWCSLMVVLPFLYLFWLKKRWRFLFGVIILSVTAIGYITPGEIVSSMMTTEIDKSKPSLQQLELNLKNITNTKPNDSDDDKLSLEKEIKRQERRLEKIRERLIKEDGDKEQNILLLRQIYFYQNHLIGQWAEKWGEKNVYQTLLFCGEEFNKELTREIINDKSEKKKRTKQVEELNIIDFEKTENNKVDNIQKSLEKIAQQDTWGHFPIIWLKNVDKITDSKVKNKLLEIVDSEKNTNLGEFYQEEQIKKDGMIEKIKSEINLSRFTLVVTTSVNNPRTLPSELRAKLKHIELLWNKYCWWIFIFSLGIEIVVFYLLIKKSKKTQLLLAH